jgi:hypothetical protein
MNETPETSKYIVQNINSDDDNVRWTIAEKKQDEISGANETDLHLKSCLLS